MVVRASTVAATGWRRRVRHRDRGRDRPGLELPDIDVTRLASAYGICAVRAESLNELTATVKAALSSDEPRLIEVSQQPLPAR
jgi:thiamine pyrophosphate-dependent acetolactate synthase large subunit-like protein